MTTNLHTAIEILFRTGVIYFLILLGVRLSGKREVGQMTPFDLALLLLLSNAVQNAMTGPDTSVSGGIVAAATLLLINAGVNQIVWKNRKARMAIEGSPTILIRHGRMLEKNLKKEKVTA